MAIEAAQFVGDIPKHYDEALGPVLFEGYAADLAKRAARFSPRDVLELACGTGILTKHLAALPGARLVATDLNAPMLDIARARPQGARAIEFRTADAMALPFAEKTFDLVVCQYGVMFFPDKVLSFCEARRVLRPAGRYLFNVWASLEANRFAKIIDDLGRALLPERPPQFYPVPFGYHDRNAIASDLTLAGFGDPVFATVRLTRPIDDWARFARGLVFGNPFAGELEAQGASAEAAHRILTERLRAHFGPEPAKLPLEAIVVIAERG